MDMTRNETEQMIEDSAFRMLENVADIAQALTGLFELGAADIDVVDADGLAQALAVARAVGRTAAPVNFSALVLGRLAGQMLGRDGVAVGQMLPGNDIAVAGQPNGTEIVLALDDCVANSWKASELEIVSRASFDNGSEVIRYRTHPAVDADRYDATTIALVQLALADAEMLAAVATMIDRTIEHLKTRVQFGRPIGSLQALQHRMADAHVATQAARLASEYASTLIFSTDADRTVAWCHASHAYAAETATKAAQTCFQFHGGMAFTADFWPHRWLRRVFRLAAQGGAPQHHYDRAARYIQSDEKLNQFVAL